MFTTVVKPMSVRPTQHPSPYSPHLLGGEDEDNLAEVYPSQFTSQYRRFRLDDGATCAEVDVWSHNRTTWVTLSGALTPAASRQLATALVRCCRGHRGLTINTSELDAGISRDQLAWVALTLAAVGVPVHLIGPEAGAGHDDAAPTPRLPAGPVLGR